MTVVRALLARMRSFKSAIVANTCLFALLAMVATPTAAQTAKHPLDGLTAEEYWAVYETMKASGHVDSKSRYHIVLHEPPKEEVLAWKPGQPFPREALVVVKQGPSTFEAVVDANGRKLISWKEIKGVQSYLTREESTTAGDAVKENPEWQAAMRKRGITDYETVSCGSSGYGYWGTPEEQGRRLLYVTCENRRGVSANCCWNIEGLTVLWDANEGKVLRVIDTGVVPVPLRAPANFDVESGGPLREFPTPITIQQPLGPSFRVQGHEVSWQKWNFHFRIDRRGGPVVSNVRYVDGDKVRSILYEGSLTEVFVSYMDPDEYWWESSFFDLGEGGGELSSSLEPGVDCPENSIYFEQVYANEKGIPERIHRAACLFEQYAGGFAWRHNPDAVESRKQRDLVLRTIGDFGNYDYAFDWVFRQDGTIKVRVGLTGLDQRKTVTSRTADDDHDGQAGAYGRFLTENAVGVNHDHFFSFRLDFDVDGTANSFVRDRLRTKRLPQDSPRKSMWVAEPEVARTEKQAKLRMSMEQPEIWRVINPNVKNPMGYPVGYEIVPGENAMSLLLPEDYSQRRAGFTDYQLWVTRYQENERYAAGDYPMLSKGGDGLPAWTKANRGIENTDIVLWYTMGFHHVPRSEEWPVMPTIWHEFELRPNNFFSRNPALDLPKQP